MVLVAERSHNKHGSSVFVRYGLKVNSISVCEEDTVEFITVYLTDVVGHSVYKPQAEQFLLPPLEAETCLTLYLATSTTTAHAGDTPQLISTTLQQTSSPDITTVSNTLYNRTSWITQHALSSDHLPIITTINIRHDYTLQQNRRTFTNYKKTDWTQFTEDTESAFAQTTIPTNIHTANIIFTNIILMADKHNIPKGKMHSNCRLLPDHIVCKITQRNNIRRANTCDPAHKLLNEEITSNIQKHKQNIWKEHLDAHWHHRHNPHILLKTIHGLSNRAPPLTLNTSITFSNKTATTPKHIAYCFPKQFTNTVEHETNKTNRYINRATQKYKDTTSHSLLLRSKRL